MSNVILPAVIIGGVTYELVATQSATPPGPIRWPGGNASTGTLGRGSGQPIPGWDPQTGFYDNAPPGAQQAIDSMLSQAQAAYEVMSPAARAAAADEMNQALELDPPLNGNETWETIARVAGGAAAAGACNAIPGIGTAASPLCAIAGAYLGVKLEEWLSKAVPDAVDATIGWFRGFF